MKSLSLKTSMLVVAIALGTSAAHAEAGDTFIRIRGIMIAPTESSGPILPAFPTEEVKVNNSVMPQSRHHPYGQRQCGAGAHRCDHQA